MTIDGINQAELVERPEVTAAIEEALSPRQWYHRYGLIAGNHGTGRTSLFRTRHRLPGIIYADVPPTRKGFDFALINALRWTPPVSSWSRVLIDRLVNRKHPDIGRRSSMVPRHDLFLNNANWSDSVQPFYSQTLDPFRETA